MAETWRATEKAHRRARYLREASHLFAERGYRAVSIDDLGAAVGVSGPALYRHFANKEEMLIELLVGATERLQDGFNTTVARGLPDLETLRELVDFHLDFAVAERDVIRIQERELAALPPEANRRVRRQQREYIEGWQQIAARLRPELSEANLRVRMHALFGILNSTPYLAGVEQDEVREVLADVALAAVLGEHRERVNG